MARLPYAYGGRVPEEVREALLKEINFKAKASIARKLGGSGKLIDVKGGTEAVKKNLHDTLGHFAEGNRAAEANRELAAELAQSVANAQERGQLRKSVATGRLYKALTDPQNRWSNNSGFGVGNTAFLSKSGAKYWRQIDQGTNVHVGQIFHGLWGESVEGWVNGYPRAVRPFHRASKSRRGDRLRPLNAEALREFRDSGFGAKEPQGALGFGYKGKRSPPPWSTFVIRKPIRAQEYFRRGWEDFDKEAAAARIIERLMNRR